MKKSIMMTAGALAVFAVGNLFADDAAKAKPAAATAKKSSAVKAAGGGPADRNLEIRVGPRVSMLDGDVRIGRTGTEFNVKDDLQLDDVNPGIQFDIDYQPINNLHLEAGLSIDMHNQTGTTGKTIQPNGRVRLASGALVTTAVDVTLFEGKAGWDVYKSNIFCVRPYVGVRGAYINGTVTETGVTLTGTTGVGGARDTETARVDTLKASFFGGLDSRAYFTHSLYAGIDAGGFGWDNVGFISGDAYLGYDFSKSWGLRAGYTADYVTYKNSNDSQKADAVLGAAYLQVVAGF